MGGARGGADRRGRELRAARPWGELWAAPTIEGGSSGWRGHGGARVREAPAPPRAGSGAPAPPPTSREGERRPPDAWEREAEVVEGGNSRGAGRRPSREGARGGADHRGRELGAAWPSGELGAVPARGWGPWRRPARGGLKGRRPEQRGGEGRGRERRSSDGRRGGEVRGGGGWRGGEKGAGKEADDGTSKSSGSSSHRAFRR